MPGHPGAAPRRPAPRPLLGTARLPALETTSGGACRGGEDVEKALLPRGKKKKKAPRGSGVYLVLNLVLRVRNSSSGELYKTGEPNRSILAASFCRAVFFFFFFSFMRFDNREMRGGRTDLGERFFPSQAAPRAEVQR